MTHALAALANSCRRGAPLSLLSRLLTLALALQAGGCSDAVVSAPVDAGQDAAVGGAPTPPQCPPGPWIAVRLNDGGSLRWQCAPDFPVWGDQPLAPEPLQSQPDGTAVDSLTGLHWQSAPPPAALSQAAAAASCDALELGGHRDWRLPTVAELQSLVDYSRHHPALPQTLAAATDAGEFWSLVERNSLGWTVEFERGQVRQRPRHQPWRVRCVRSERPDSPKATDRFSFKNKETAADALLGLEWLRPVAVNTYTLPSTVGWCSKLSASGGGWRVPTLRQLSSLVHRSSPWGTVDSSVFGGNLSTIWSYTISADDPTYAWTVDFSNGTSSAMEIYSFADVRCVRDLK